MRSQSRARVRVRVHMHAGQKHTQIESLWASSASYIDTKGYSTFL